MTAVIIGTFGAHVLKEIITHEMLETYKTGVQYQFYHTFALLAAGILMHFNTSKALGIITPLGGVVWIIAWILLAVHCSKYIPSK